MLLAQNFQLYNNVSCELQWGFCQWEVALDLSKRVKNNAVRSKTVHQVSNVCDFYITKIYKILRTKFI